MAILCGNSKGGFSMKKPFCLFFLLLTGITFADKIPIYGQFTRFQLIGVPGYSEETLLSSIKIDDPIPAAEKIQCNNYWASTNYLMDCGLANNVSNIESTEINATLTASQFGKFVSIPTRLYVASNDDPMFMYVYNLSMDSQGNLHIDRTQ